MQRGRVCFILLFASSLALTSIGQTEDCSATDYPCQITKFTKAIRDNPKDPENYYNIGIAHQKSGDHKRAIEMFNMYLSIPGIKASYLADGYNNRGTSNRKLWKPDLALADFIKASELVPTDPAFIVNQGNANTDLKRYETALADYARALKMKPNYAPAFSGRAHVYSTIMRFDESIRDFSSAIATDPSDPELYYNRGVVYGLQKNYLRAIPDYDKYLSMMQGNPVYLADGYMNRGIALAATGRRDEALNDFTKSIELDPARAAAYRARAMIYRELKNVALAEADERRAAQLERPN